MARHGDTPHFLTKGLKAVPIDSVDYYPGNARVGDLDLIKESLVAHGQFKPLIVQQSTNYVLIGNNTKRGAAELGWSKVQIATVDVDDEQARKINLIDNRANDKSEWDWDLLGELLGPMQDYDASGFTSTEVETMLQDIHAAQDQATQQALTAANLDTRDPDDDGLSPGQNDDNRTSEQVLADEAKDGTQFDTLSPEIHSILQLRADVKFTSNEPWEIPPLDPAMLVSEAPLPLDTWSGPTSSTDDGVSTYFYVYSTDSTRGMPWDRAAMCFYVDDTRFDNWWTDPATYTARAINAGLTMMVEPDFSLWDEMPKAMRLYNVYRNRWLGRYFQEAGLKVIPNITWGDPGDESWVFAGVPARPPVVAMQIQTHRDIRESEVRYVHHWLHTVEDILKPGSIILYGNVSGHELGAGAGIKTPIHNVLSRSAHRNRWKRERDQQDGIPDALRL